MRSKAIKGEVIPANVGGRPPKYDPAYCDVVMEIGKQGGWIPRMCRDLGVKSEKTIYNWRDNYPEFAEALEAARIYSAAHFEDVLALMAIGNPAVKGGNFNAVAMILNNRHKEYYTRNPNGSTTEINIGSINTIESLSTKEIEERLLKVNSQLKALEQLHINDPVEPNAEE